MIGLSILSAMAAAQTNFGPVALGSSASETVTLTITTAGTPSIVSVVTQGIANLDFTNAGGGTCSTGTAYAAEATCTVNVTFAPTAAGTREGAVVLGSSSAVLATVYLAGTGQGPQATFLPGVVSTVASGFPSGFVNLAVDAGGDVFVSDLALNVGVEGIYEETPGAGKYTQTNVVSPATGPLSLNLAIDGAGNLFVGNGDGAVDEVALVGGTYAPWNEISSFYAVNDISAIAADANGDLFVACGSDCTYVLTPSNGQYKTSEFDGGLIKFANPNAVAVDGAGDVYVLSNPELYKETPADGSYTQTEVPLNMAYVWGRIAADGLGYLYMGLQGVNTSPGIYKLTPSGEGYTQTPIGTDHQWMGPESIAVDSKGNVYVVDAPANPEDGSVEAVYKIDLADPPALNFDPTFPGATSFDSPKTVTVSNLGNEPLVFTAVSSYPANFPEASGVESDCTSSTSLAPEASCTLSINFTPEAPLTSQPLSGNVAITTNTLNSAATTQQVAVSGSETDAPVMNLTAMSNPAYIGAKVTFKATVTASGVGAPLPTGSVTFYSGNSSLGSVALANGAASVSTSTLAPGTYSITAHYPGDSNYGALTSGVLTEVINKYTPTFSLVPSANPATVESYLQFIATISGSIAGSPAPTGTVAFYSDGSSLGSAQLFNSVASLVAPKLTAGNHSISAVYSGDANFNGLTSVAFIETIDRLTPVVSLVSSANPGKAGSPLGLTATVGGAGAGSPAPTGTVTFYSGNSSLGSAELSNGTANLTTSKLTPGKDSITAAYLGDANYAALSSSALTEVVDKIAAAIRLVSSANPGKVESAIKFTASVTDASGISPAGIVTFYAGTRSLGSATLSKGVSEFPVKLAAGSYAITAKYAGDADLNAVTSEALTEVVDKLVPSVKLTSSANPSKAGSAVTFKATVAGSGMEPAGSVVFKSGTTTLGTAALKSGKAQWSTDKLAAGSYRIAASYSGSAVYKPETSLPLEETIEK